MTSLNPVLTIGTQIIETLQAHLAWTRRRHPTRCRAAGRRRHPRARAAPAAVPAPALRRHAPARGDRHRAVVRAQAPDRRRADDGARRHGAGADPRPAGARAAAPPHGDDPDHARPRRRRRPHRRGRGDVCRARRRARADALLFTHMRMPYTEALLAAIPKLDSPPDTPLPAIAGRPPDQTRPLEGLLVRAALPLRRRSLPRCQAAACRSRTVGWSLRLLGIRYRARCSPFRNLVVGITPSAARRCRRCPM